MKQRDHYDYASFSRPIGFDELEAGCEFPAFEYRITEDHARSYLKSVDEKSEAMLAAIPSLCAFSYGFFYSAMKARPPTGYINAAVDLRFLRKIALWEPLRMVVKVQEKFEKRGRKHVVFRLDVHVEDGATAGTALVDCIFPH